MTYASNINGPCGEKYAWMTPELCKLTVIYFGYLKNSKNLFWHVAGEIKFFSLELCT